MELNVASTKQEISLRYNADLCEVFELFSRRGFTLRETAERLRVNPSSLKTWAWREGIKFAPDRNKARYLPHYIDYQGSRYTLSSLATKCGVNRKTLSTRIGNGWSIEEATTTPVRAGIYKHRLGHDRELTGLDAGRLWLRGKL